MPGGVAGAQPQGCPLCRFRRPTNRPSNQLRILAVVLGTPWLLLQPSIRMVHFPPSRMFRWRCNGRSHSSLSLNALVVVIDGVWIEALFPGFRVEADTASRFDSESRVVLRAAALLEDEQAMVDRWTVILWGEVLEEESFWAA